MICVETKDYKVGDEIEMKLMRKSKGTVYVCPKSEWKDREGVPHNIDGKDDCLLSPSYFECLLSPSYFENSPFIMRLTLHFVMVIL